MIRFLISVIFFPTYFWYPIAVKLKIYFNFPLEQRLNVFRELDKINMDSYFDTAIYRYNILVISDGDIKKVIKHINDDIDYSDLHMMVKEHNNEK